MDPNLVSAGTDALELGAAVFLWLCVAVVAVVVGYHLVTASRERRTRDRDADRARLDGWAATLRGFNRDDGRAPAVGPWQPRRTRHVRHRAGARSVWTLPGITQYHTYRAGPSHAKVVS